MIERVPVLDRSDYSVRWENAATESLRTLARSILDISTYVDHRGQLWGHDTSLGHEDELTSDVMSLIQNWQRGQS